LEAIMTQHQIHDRLPSGFAYADKVQAADFASTGSVHGASKVCLVRPYDADAEPDLAVRLRPPMSVEDVTLDRALIASEITRLGLTGDEARDWYKAQYNAGWAASKRVGRTGSDSVAFDRGSTTHSWDDGYLDQAAGRPKWHLTWCVDHDVCGEG
jgi:hypothetical protein